MAQHFLLSATARSLSAAKIMRMSESGVENVFLRLRWPETDGKPVCPDCGGSGANFGLVATSLCSNCFSCGEHSSPDGGCGFGLNLKFAEVELVFANAVEKFDAGDGNFCSSEPFEAEHGTYLGFYSTMVLFNDIVEH